MLEFLAPPLDPQYAILNQTHSGSPPLLIHLLELTGNFLEPFIEHEHKIYSHEDRKPEVPNKSGYNFHDI